MDDLLEKLRAVEGGRPDSLGISTMWHRNPEGPQAADRIEKLEAALRWYADQMCEGLCQGKDPKACANIGADNCAGCPAVVALTP